MRQQSLHILFVDDNPGDRELAREALEYSGSGVRLHTASDGLDAMNFLRKTGQFSEVPRPHVVLLDLNMPIKNGMETLQEIKADEELKSIPVVVFSSSASPADMNRAYASHANAFVVKPGELEDFLGVMQRIKSFWHETAVVRL